MGPQNSFPLFQVDAFTTNKAFSGNPAAVCLLEAPQDAAWMQAVAAEMNLSETAFVRPVDDGLELRWFTPAVDVDLCGHATLAAAHVLWAQGVVRPGKTIVFQTLSGHLPAKPSGDWIELDFPEEPVTRVDAPEGLLPALGVDQASVYRNRLDYLVSVATAAGIRALVPDFPRLKTIDMRGVIVTAPADEPAFDLVSRFFAPAAGIDEDPVTGSAHCALYPFWRERLNKDELTAYQASSRGGRIKLRGQGGRVTLTGQAVTVMSGALHV